MYRNYKIEATDDGLDIICYVPGYTKDELNVSRTGSQLVIEGATESEYALEQQFNYKFEITNRVGKIDSEYHDGVLIVHVKSREYNTQRITIR